MIAFMQAIKTGALFPEHLKNGIWLDEDDHGLALKHDTEVIARWGIYANFWDIQRTATEWLEQHGTENSL